MSAQRKPKSHAFVWYGREGEGIDIFHGRLTVELREDLSGAGVVEVRPEWPLEVTIPARSFGDVLCEAFAVNDLVNVPAPVRSESGGISGRNTLINVRHLPVENPPIINPGSLKLYLEWWNAHFVKLLERHQYALLGVSFIINNPERFRRAILDEDELEN